MNCQGSRGPLENGLGLWPLAFTLKTHHEWLVLVLIMNGKGFLQRLEGKKSPLPFVWILLLE